METIKDSAQEMIDYLEAVIQSFNGKSRYHNKAKRFLKRVKAWEGSAVHDFQLKHLESHDREMIENKLKLMKTNPITTMEAVILDLTTLESIYELIQANVNKQ